MLPHFSEYEGIDDWIGPFMNRELNQKYKKTFK